MFALTRWNSLDDVFGFQRDIDRVFNQFWSDLPTRTAAGQSPSFQVTTSDDGWRIDVPLPGIDPQHVNLEASGSTLTIRAEEPGEKGHDPAVFGCREDQRFSQTRDAAFDRSAQGQRQTAPHPNRNAGRGPKAIGRSPVITLSDAGFARADVDGLVN
jgi:HSP20 family molecular chaperone IbpA